MLSALWKKGFLVALGAALGPSARAGSPDSTTLEAVALGFDVEACAVSDCPETVLVSFVATASGAVGLLEAVALHRNEVAAARVVLGEATIRAAATAADEGNVVLAQRELDVLLVQYRASAATARQTLFMPFEASLSEADHQMLQSAVNDAHRSVPAEYRVLSLSEAEWAALESAVAKRTSNEADLAPSEAQVLAAAESSPEVAIARTRIQQRGTAIRAQLTSAIKAELAASMATE